MLNKYSRIQDLIDRQKEKKQYLEEVFLNIFNTELTLPEKVKYEVVFGTEQNGNSEVKVKIKDRSSVKFVVEKNKQRVIDKYLEKYSKDVIWIK